MSDSTESGARRLEQWLLRAYHSWATRSLAVGGAATVIDICVLLLCVRLFELPNPVAAMVGVTVGSTFTFFANRHFAFRDHNPKLAPQALKFCLATLGAMTIHASLVWLIADRWGAPVVLAKLAADILVFSVGQLLVLRYLVFPKHKGPDVSPSSETLLARRPTASPALRTRSGTPEFSHSRSQRE